VIVLHNLRSYLSWTYVKSSASPPYGQFESRHHLSVTGGTRALNPRIRGPSM